MTCQEVRVDCFDLVDRIFKHSGKSWQNVDCEAREYSKPHAVLQCVHGRICCVPKTALTWMRMWVLLYSVDRRL
jgi:hypothetical protein